MSDFRSPLPEFSHLLLCAADALTGIRKNPDMGFTEEQRNAVATMLDFANDYNIPILEAMKSPR